MPTPLRQWADEAEPLLVDEWRRDQFKLLRDKGGRTFSRGEVDALVEARVDWHRLHRMLDKGCDLDVAREIVL